MANPFAITGTNRPNPFESRATQANPFESSKKNPFEVKTAENPFEKSARLERERLEQERLERERIEQARREQERADQLAREQARLSASESSDSQPARRMTMREYEQSVAAKAKARKDAANNKTATAKSTAKPAAAAKAAATKPASASTGLTLSAEKSLSAEYNGRSKSFKYGGSTGKTKAEAEADAKQWENMAHRTEIRAEYRRKWAEFQKEKQEAAVERYQNWKAAHPAKPAGAGEVTGGGADDEDADKKEFENTWNDLQKTLENAYKRRLDLYPVKGDNNYL